MKLLISTSEFRSGKSIFFSILAVDDAFVVVQVRIMRMIALSSSISRNGRADRVEPDGIIANNNSSLTGVVGGTEVVPLRGVGPHSHPLTESSKRGSGRARPRLIAELLSPWEVCDAKGLIEVLAVGPV